ncbi:MAG: PQQ-binding-like beta-propeller repeat protein [Planctomycetaceae bacterium]|nr:PQQ-binding-like beta-propeller repeat protein [Planctomycetaceae bacterium]
MKFTATAAIVLATAGFAHAADESAAWSQFRGPNGSGVADGESPPVEIGPDKNVKWKVTAPAGMSSPIIAGDKLFITAFEDGKLLTVAYNRADGSELWRADAGAQQLEKYYEAESSPAASTPATDGQHVVSYFGSCGLRCYDLAGNELWRYELPPARLPGNFGSGVSPIVIDGVVVLVRDTQDGSEILALDIASGEVKWHQPRQSMVSYSTPVAWKTPTGTQVVASGRGRLVSYDLQTGSEVWSVEGMPSVSCSSPVIADDIAFFAGWAPGGPDSEFQMPSFDQLLKDLDKDGDKVLSQEEGTQQFGGMFDSMDANSDGKIVRDEIEALAKFMADGTNSAFAVKGGGHGDLTESNVLWRQTKGLPYVPTAIAYRGQFLMVKDGGIVTAYDAKTGEQIYMERAVQPGRYYASPVAADGHVYFASLDEGVITVIEAGGDSPKELAKSESFGERISATPAIADDTLYVRTAGHLYAFGE